MEKFGIVRNPDGELSIGIWKGEHKPLMECGHVANAYALLPVNEEYTDQMQNSRNGKIYVHSCVICDSDVIAEDQTMPDDRKAKCSLCGKVVDSSYDLAFFKYQPDKEYDDYYCGCEGWN